MDKTPDEIKRGLECCHFTECGNCPYMTENIECREIFSDALAYIRQLEAENDNLRLSFAKQSSEVAERNLELLKIIQQAVEKLPKWISVEERLPDNFVSVLGYMTDAGDLPPVRECYTVGNVFVFPALCDKHPVSHWMPLPEPPKEE